MAEQDRERIARAAREEAEDGRIACAKALALAKRLGVGPSLVGEVLNEQKIKIVQCQLGCFGWHKRGGGEQG